MSIIGLREQTVHGAKSIAEARARHRWNIPADYNVAVDCLDRHTDLRDKPALYFADDEGRAETYTFGQIGALSRRFANAMVGLGIKRGDVVAVHRPRRPETAIPHMGFYRIGAIALPISKLFGPDALKYRLTNSSAKAILVEPDSIEKIDPIRKDVPELRHVVVVGGKQGGLAFDDLIAKASDQFAMGSTHSEDPILL